MNQHTDNGWEKHKDALVAVFLLAISLCYLYLIATMPSLATAGRLSNEKFLPYLLFFALAGCSVLQATLSVRGKSKGGWDHSLRDYKTALAVIFIFIGYVWLLPQLGFKISTPLFAAALTAAVGGWHSPITVVLTSLAITVFTYFIFAYGFKVFLPQGIF